VKLIDKLIKSKTQQKLILGTLIVIVFLLYFMNSWSYDLWSPDEPRYAEVARETALNGNWIIPQLNQRTYYEKPPLYFNLVALSGLLIGRFSVTSVRLPGIIIAVLLLAFLTYFVRKEIDFLTGILSFIILATTINFFWLAMKVNLDIPLLFCTTLASLLLFRNRDNYQLKRWTTYLAFLLMGLGTLIKSPISILPVLTIIIYLFLHKNIYRLKKFPWLGSFFFLFLPGIIWLYLAYHIAGYSYLKTAVFDQLIGYSTGGQGHPQPFYYYLINFPLQALPWSLFLIPGFYYSYKLRFNLPDLLNYAIVSFLVIFLVFSLVGSKRGVYLMQLYPFAAIIIAWFFKLHFNGKIKNNKSIIIPTLIMAILFLFLGMYLYLQGVDLLTDQFQINLQQQSGFVFFYHSLVYLFIITSLILITITLFRSAQFNFSLIVLFGVILLIMLKTIFLPTLNQVKSERYLANDLAAAYTKQAEIGLWGSLNNDSGFVFYTGIYYDYIFENENEVKYFLAKPGKQILIINDVDKWEESSFKDIYQQYFRLKQYQVGSNKMLLLTEN
jgi:4-amino-4-deoxy-L-arabinose transferase-like glycosyltransferase